MKDIFASFHPLSALLASYTCRSTARTLSNDILSQRFPGKLPPLFLAWMLKLNSSSISPSRFDGNGTVFAAPTLAFWKLCPITWRDGEGRPCESNSILYPCFASSGSAQSVQPFKPLSKVS